MRSDVRLTRNEGTTPLAVLEYIFALFKGNAQAPCLISTHGHSRGAGVDQKLNGLAVNEPRGHEVAPEPAVSTMAVPCAPPSPRQC